MTTKAFAVVKFALMVAMAATTGLLLLPFVAAAGAGFAILLGYLGWALGWVVGAALGEVSINISVVVLITVLLMLALWTEFKRAAAEEHAPRRSALIGTLHVGLFVGLPIFLGALVAALGWSFDHWARLHVAAIGLVPVLLLGFEILLTHTRNLGRAFLWGEPTIETCPGEAAETADPATPKEPATPTEPSTGFWKIALRVFLVLSLPSAALGAIDEGWVGFASGIMVALGCGLTAAGVTTAIQSALAPCSGTRQMILRSVGASLSLTAFVYVLHEAVYFDNYLVLRNAELAAKSMANRWDRLPAHDSERTMRSFALLAARSRNARPSRWLLFEDVAQRNAELIRIGQFAESMGQNEQEWIQWIAQRGIDARLFIFRLATGVESEVYFEKMWTPRAFREMRARWDNMSRPYGRLTPQMLPRGITAVSYWLTHWFTKDLDTEAEKADWRNWWREKNVRLFAI